MEQIEQFVKKWSRWHTDEFKSDLLKILKEVARDAWNDGKQQGDAFDHTGAVRNGLWIDRQIERHFFPEYFQQIITQINS